MDTAAITIFVIAILIVGYLAYRVWGTSQK
jgi:hypothetical protein